MKETLTIMWPIALRRMNTYEAVSVCVVSTHANVCELRFVQLSIDTVHVLSTSIFAASTVFIALGPW